MKENLESETMKKLNSVEVHFWGPKDTLEVELEKLGHNWMREHFLMSDLDTSVQEIFQAGDGMGFPCMMILDTNGRLINIYPFYYDHDFDFKVIEKIVKMDENTLAPEIDPEPLPKKGRVSVKVIEKEKENEEGEVIVEGFKVYANEEPIHIGANSLEYGNYKIALREIKDLEKYDLSKSIIEKEIVIDENHRNVEVEFKLVKKRSNPDPNPDDLVLPNDVVDRSLPLNLVKREYVPGEYLEGTLRTLSTYNYPVSNVPIKIEIRKPNGEVSVTINQATDYNGNFSFRAELLRTLETGIYSVKANGYIQSRVVNSICYFKVINNTDDSLKIMSFKDREKNGEYEHLKDQTNPQNVHAYRILNRLYGKDLSNLNGTKLHQGTETTIRDYITNTTKITLVGLVMLDNEPTMDRIKKLTNDSFFSDSVNRLEMLFLGNLSEFEDSLKKMGCEELIEKSMVRSLASLKKDLFNASNGKGETLTLVLDTNGRLINIVPDYNNMDISLLREITNKSNGTIAPFLQNEDLPDRPLYPDDDYDEDEIDPNEDQQDKNIYLVTDKRKYEKGDTMFADATVTDMYGRAYVNTFVRFTVKSPSGKMERFDSRTDGNGRCQMKISISEVYEIGKYQLFAQANVGGWKQSMTNFLVKEKEAPPLPPTPPDPDPDPNPDPRPDPDPKPIIYRVSFVGTNLPDVEVRSGDKVARPLNPSKEGYNFGGWYIDASFRQMFNFNTPITKNTKIYAKWEEEAPAPPEPEYFTVTFVGTNYRKVSVKAGERVRRPQNPTRSGYTFGGWYADSSYRQMFNFNTPITKDTSIYAKWNKYNPNPDPDPDPNPDPGPGPNPGRLTPKSFTQRDQAGEFRSLKQNSDIYSFVKNNYGRHISSINGLSSFLALDSNQTISGSSKVGGRVTILGIGGPWCGYCVQSWRTLNSMNLSDCNLVELLYSSTTAELDNTLSYQGLTALRRHFVRAQANFGGIFSSNFTGAPVILYFDETGKLINGSRGLDSNGFRSIVNSIKGTTAN